MKVVLASASPRRRELIKQTGVDFEVYPSGAEEYVAEALQPREYAETMAKLKAEAVAKEKTGVILGADTIVVLDGEILGKPTSSENAAETLRRLSGKKHSVITGYCVIYGTYGEKRKVGSAVSNVFFNELSDELISEYISTGLCMDKAGSYGIQDGFPLVARVEGSLSNVIGLPVEELTAIFKEVENEQYKAGY